MCRDPSSGTAWFASLQPPRPRFECIEPAFLPHSAGDLLLLMRPIPRRAFKIDARPNKKEKWVVYTYIRLCEFSQWHHITYHTRRCSDIKGRTSSMTRAGQAQPSCNRATQHKQNAPRPPAGIFFSARGGGAVCERWSAFFSFVEETSRFLGSCEKPSLWLVSLPWN